MIRQKFVPSETVIPPNSLKPHLRDRIVIYASGMSRIGDLTAGTCTWGGLRSRGIGVEVGELSENGIDELAQAIVARKVRAFVDSGAYNLFRRKLKTESEGAGAVRPLDFGKVLDRYEAIQATVAYYNEPPIEWPDEPMTAEDAWERHEYERMGFGCEEKVPSPLFVMPDVVGDQSASLALVRRYASYIRNEANWGIATPIVPIQKGEISFTDAYREALDILGTNAFVLGVPSVESAMSLDELRAFLEDAAIIGLHGIHFLGSASPRTLDPRLDVIAETGIELDHLSADANILRGSLYGQKQAQGPGAPETRREAIGDKLYEKAPEMQAEGPHPRASRAAAQFRRTLHRDGIAEFEGRTFRVKERRLRGGGKSWIYTITTDGGTVIRGGIWPDNWTRHEATRAASREAFPWDDSRTLFDVNAVNAERERADDARMRPVERRREPAEMADRIRRWDAMTSTTAHERRSGFLPFVNAHGVAPSVEKKSASAAIRDAAARTEHTRAPRGLHANGNLLIREAAEVVAAFLRTVPANGVDVPGLIRDVRRTLVDISEEASSLGPRHAA